MHFIAADDIKLGSISMRVSNESKNIQIYQGGGGAREQGKGIREKVLGVGEKRGGNVGGGGGGGKVKACGFSVMNVCL